MVICEANTSNASKIRSTPRQRVEGIFDALAVLNPAAQTLDKRQAR